MLKQYKKILASILPPSMLTLDGFLKTTTGQPEPIAFKNSSPPRELWWPHIAWRSWQNLFAKKCEGRAFYDGCLYEKVLRYRVAKREDSLTDTEYEALNEWAEQQIAEHASHDVICTSNSKHKGVLAHETFHDIQGFLLDYHPALFEKLLGAVDRQRDRIANWMADPANYSWTGPQNYKFEHFFPDPQTTTPAYPPLTDAMMHAFHRSGKQPFSVGDDPGRMFEFIGNTSLEVGRLEAIPVLLSAASVRNQGAIEILQLVFREVGFNPDFYQTLPRA